MVSFQYNNQDATSFQANQTKEDEEYEIITADENEKPARSKTFSSYMKKVFWKSDDDNDSKEKETKTDVTCLNEISPIIQHTNENSYENFTDWTLDDNSVVSLSSGFLKQLCKILKDVYLQIFISFCHKKKVIFIRDIREFEQNVLQLRNPFLKAGSFLQFNRQMLLRGFNEAESLRLAKTPYRMIYEHVDEDLLKKLAKVVVDTKNDCCRRHYIY